MDEEKEKNVFPKLVLKNPPYYRKVWRSVTIALDLVVPDKKRGREWKRFLLKEREQRLFEKLLQQPKNVSI